MTSHRIAFIGGGNMASSIIGGLIASGWDTGMIRVADPSAEQRRRLHESFGIVCFESNSQCVENAQVVLLATKPQVLKQAIASISHDTADTATRQRPLYASIAAGITSHDIASWLGGDAPVVRVMPNTPALINKGVAALYANDQCNEKQRQLAQQIMRSVGETIWVEEESDIDTVTGISGSGPAYFFKLMEIMVSNAVKNGLSEDNARTLVIETALGAAALAKHSEYLPGTLRKQVTSPGGTTEAALNSMEASGIDSSISDGIDAAIARSRELAKLPGAS